MTKQMSNEAFAHELVFGSVWPTERNCTSGISRANECAAAIIFCRCSALPGSFSHTRPTCISERNVFHVVFPFLGVDCWCVQIAQSCFSAPRRSVAESRLSVFERGLDARGAHVAAFTLFVILVLPFRFTAQLSQRIDDASKTSLLSNR